MSTPSLSTVPPLPVLVFVSLSEIVEDKVDDEKER